MAIPRFFRWHLTMVETSRLHELLELLGLRIAQHPMLATPLCRQRGSRVRTVHLELLDDVMGKCLWKMLESVRLNGEMMGKWGVFARNMMGKWWENACEPTIVGKMKHILEESQLCAGRFNLTPYMSPVPGPPHPPPPPPPMVSPPHS